MRPIESGTQIVTTGIEALDDRIGGFAAGRYYLMTGSPGSGKTTATLQFLEAGLRAGETCAVLTQDDPSDLLAHGTYLGFDLRSAEQQGRLVVLRYRLDFARNYSRAEDAAVVFQELLGYVSSVAPTRLVIDSILPFLDGGRAGDGALAAFQRFLERGAETTLLVAPNSIDADFYVAMYDRLVAGVGGILDFEVRGGQVREIAIRKLRHEGRSDEPLRFVIRPGVGIVEHVAQESAHALPAEVARRVVLLDVSGHVPSDLKQAIGASFDLVCYASVEKAFVELATGRFGALVVSLDPLSAEPLFEFVAGLRSAGNGAPILLYSHQKGLRSTTRARGLQAGGDDFLTDALSPQEILQRIGLAQERGHRRALREAPPEPVLLQPRDAEGSFAPLPETTLRDAVARQIASPHPVFALVFVWPGPRGVDDGWTMFANRLRTVDGDLVSVLPSGQLALYIHNVRMAEVERLLARLDDANPGCFDLGSASIYCYPRDRAELEAWAAAAALAGS